jgi:hypothetical protein
MRTRSTSEASHTNATKPFFSVQRAVAPAFFSQSAFAVLSGTETETPHAEPSAAHAVQRKCAACEAEKKILPQLEIGPVDHPLETEADVIADHVVRRQAAHMDDDRREAKPLQPKVKDTASSESHTVQRKCAACEAEKKILPQLEIGPVHDPLETEADAMADRVVRRQAVDMDDDERQATPVQAMAEDSASSGSTSPGLETALAGASGSGSPLASHAQDQMEEAFGADFSAVRVHTSAASASMSDEIGARAFTYGTDIHFNDGEFAPGTERGMHLLAHELTHVVQQNRSVRRAPKRIQAKQLVFGPATGMPKGNVIHNDGLLPLFKKPGLNPGLWVEPQVPGANGTMVARGLWGKPDFYRDNAPDGVPIGINEGLTGGFTRIGIARAAPQPPPPIMPGASVQDLDRAPKDIELGDVKPGQSGEEYLGRDQLSKYAKGIKNTAEAVNNYQTAHNHSGSWHPNPVSMGSLAVPTKVARPSTSGVRYGPLAVWEWFGKWKWHASTSMKGSLVVYKSSVSGIWAYEWMPVSVPEDVGEDRDLKKLLERLDTKVKPKLHAHKAPAPKLQDARAAAPRRSAQQTVCRLLRRKSKPQEKFDEKGWLDAYKPWRADAEKAFVDPKTKQNEAVLEALTDSKKRTGFDPGIPEAVTERAKGAKTIHHWVRYGGLYGWLRKTFDRIYVKLAGFAQKVKEKVKKLARSASSSGFGDWIKAAALALFKVAKKLGAWAISMIVDKLLDSLQEGVINIIKQIAEAVLPEGVKSKIEEAEEYKNKFEQMLADAQESLEKKLFGNKLEFFSTLNTVIEVVNTITTIVDLVKWGIRLVACASPPLLGCLWNLAVAALEWAFSKLMETCWFSQKVFGWVRDSGVQAILGFPTEVAKVIADKLNAVIPLPAGIGPLFAPIVINHREFDIDCKGDGDGDGGGGPEPTEEQKALMDVAKEVGYDKFDAFIEMAAKRAADYNVALDAERIRKLAPLIKSLTIEQMKKLAENQPTEGVPVPVEEFLKSIATLTQAERERKAERKIDYDKARRSNASFERNEIGWKPTLFVREGVASDSKEFAEAIFDIQTMLGIKPDGMAGPYTTKTFYERNKVPKDAAYNNAVADVERAQTTAEEIRRIKEILAAPYPTSSQLAKDLQSVKGSFPDPSNAALFAVGGRKLILATTEGGARIGGYYKEFEITRDKSKRVVLIDVSAFYTLDPIRAGDRYWATLTAGESTHKGDVFDMNTLVFTYAQIPKDVAGNSSFTAKNLWNLVQIGP